MYEVDIYHSEVSAWELTSRDKMHTLSCNVSLQTSVGQRVQNYSIVRAERSAGMGAVSVIITTNFKVVRNQTAEDGYVVALAKHGDLKLFSFPCLYKDVSVGSQIIINEPEYVKTFLETVFSDLDFTIEFYGPDGLLDTAAFLAQDCSAGMFKDLLSLRGDVSEKPAIDGLDDLQAKNNSYDDLHQSAGGWISEGNSILQKWSYSGDNLNHTVTIYVRYEKKGSIFSILNGVHRFCRVGIYPGVSAEGLGSIRLKKKNSDSSSDWLSAQMTRMSDGSTMVSISLRQDADLFLRMLLSEDELEISMRLGATEFMKLPLTNTSGFAALDCAMTKRF